MDEEFRAAVEDFERVAGGEYVAGEVGDDSGLLSTGTGALLFLGLLYLLVEEGHRRLR
jgi:hypothetical protein